MSTARRVSRRRVLLGAAALAALGATTAACGRSPEPPQQPDPLEAQLDLAQRDSQMARSAATTAGPFYAPPLNVVADERAAHAKALSQEISRVAAESTMSSSTTTPTTAPPAPPPSRTDVIAALRESADSAAKLAASQSGYRAGLLGSIAAACTTSMTVPLAMTEPAQ